MSRTGFSVTLALLAISGAHAEGARSASTAVNHAPPGALASQVVPGTIQGITPVQYYGHDYGHGYFGGGGHIHWQFLGPVSS